MDCCPSTKNRVNKAHRYFVRNVKKSSFCVMLLTIFFLLPGPSIHGKAENFFPDELPDNVIDTLHDNTEYDSIDDLPDKINMEEMKIRGKIDKPNIMYIIPRSKLKVDMIINDEYFLPPFIDSAKLATQTMSKEQMACDQSLLSSISKSLAHANTQEVKNGSCISCHYFEMALPNNLPIQTVTKELDQLCLKCHNSHFYHICWKEVEKMVFYFDEKSVPPTSGSSYPQDIFFQNIVCKKCHPDWIQPKTEFNSRSDHQLWQKGYDTDKFCKICHRSKVY